MELSGYWLADEQDGLGRGEASLQLTYRSSKSAKSPLARVLVSLPSFVSNPSSGCISMGVVLLLT